MRNDRRRRPPPLVSTIVVMGLVGLGTVAVAHSAVFRVQSIHVEGNRHVPTRELERLTGVDRADNLLLLSMEGVEGAVLGHPWVAQADARRSLPSTLVVRIVERSRLAWVQDADGYAVVAADGTVLERVEEPRSELVSLGARLVSLAPGDRVPGLDGALAVTARLPAGLVEQVERAGISGEEVILDLRSGGRVLYGEPARFRQKNDALTSMMRWAVERGMGVEYYDVRAPGSPVLKPYGVALAQPGPRAGGA